MKTTKRTPSWYKNVKKAYLTPKTRAVIISHEGLVCQSDDIDPQSDDNEPMVEYDNGQYGSWGI